MGDEKKLRRHAWHLMSLSSGFQVIAFVGWIFTAMIGSGADEGAPLLFLSPMWRQWIELSNPSFLTILVAKFPEWLGAFWPCTGYAGLERCCPWKRRFRPR